MYVLPPFGSVRQEPKDTRKALYEEFGHSSEWAEITLLSVLEGLSEGDRAAFTLPLQFFVGFTSQRLRSWSLELGQPELVIQPLAHPFGGGIDDRFQVQTIFFSDTLATGDAPVTRFFSIPQSGEIDHREFWDDFQQLVRQGGGETKYGFVHRGHLDPEDTWTYQSLHPELEREIDEVEVFGEVRPLDDLFKIKVSRPLRGELWKKFDAVDEELDPERSSIPVVEGRDIRSDGSIAYTDTRINVSEEDIDENNLVRLKDGDICLRDIYATRHGLVAAEVKSFMTPMASSRHVIVLRPKENTSKEDRQVVLQYLQSDTASRYVMAKRGGALILPRAKLRKMPVPMADEDLRGALRSLTEAVDLFDRWKEEAMDAARSLFDFPTTKDGKMHVLTTGRRSRQRQQAGERQDDLSYRIQTQFPHPIAYRWRTVAAAKRDLEGYLHVLECAEITSCYLALMAITLSRAVDQEIGYLKTMRGRIAKRGQGTNLGDWIAILREVRDSKAFRNLPDDTPFYETMHFMPNDTPADKALQSLSERRNDQSHGRGPRGDSVPLAFKQAKADLLTFLDAAEFASDYPLRYIELTKADTLQNLLTYSYRDVMGDHPLVPIKKDTIEPKTLEAESLYLVDRSGNLHLLRPLLLRQRCPHCGTWSTFYLDSYDADDHTCTLKSMEHAHTDRDNDVHRAFKQIGLLPEEG